MPIGLRTALVKDGVMYVQAGAGIVADSVAETEFEETRKKARALVRAAEEAVRFAGREDPGGTARVSTAISGGGLFGSGIAGVSRSLPPWRRRRSPSAVAGIPGSSDLMMGDQCPVARSCRVVRRNPSGPNRDSVA
jgi:hypothetical protein